MYSVLCTVCSNINIIVYTVSIPYYMYNVQCTLHSVHCKVYSNINIIVYTVSIPYYMYNAQCTLYTVKYAENINISNFQICSLYCSY